MNDGVEFVYRPTVLICDGDNLWEVPDILSTELHEAVEGCLPIGIQHREWVLVAPTGCRGCELCLKKLSLKLRPGEKRCTRCLQPTSDYDHKLRGGFCATCDMRHYNAWHESDRSTTFTEWREYMRDRFAGFSEALQSQ